MFLELHHPAHSGLVGGGLGILGSNFFIVFFASWGLLTCIGVGKNATNHLKGSISVPNPCLLWPKMSILHCYLQYCMKFLLPRKTFYLAEKSCYTMIFWDKIDIWKPVRMPYSLKNHVWKFNFCLKISYYQVMCFFLRYTHITTNLISWLRFFNWSWLIASLAPRKMFRLISESN